jgi:hypothetical protein
MDKNAKQDSNKRKRTSRKMLAAVQHQLDIANGLAPSNRRRRTADGVQPVYQHAPDHQQHEPCRCGAAAPDLREGLVEHVVTVGKRARHEQPLQHVVTNKRAKRAARTTQQNQGRHQQRQQPQEQHAQPHQPPIPPVCAAENLVERVVTNNRVPRTTRRQRVQRLAPAPPPATSDSDTDGEAISQQSMARLILPKRQRSIINRLQGEWKVFTGKVFTQLLIICSFCGTAGWSDGKGNFVGVTPGEGEATPLLIM